MYHSCCYHSWCYRLNKFYYSASDSKNGSFANVVAYSGTSLMYLELTNSLFNGWSGNAWILRLIEFSFIETNNVHEMNTEPQFLRYSKSDGTKVIKLYTFICMTFHWTWNVMHNIHFIDSLICMTFISLTRSFAWHSFHWLYRLCVFALRVNRQVWWLWIQWLHYYLGRSARLSKWALTLICGRPGMGRFQCMCDRSFITDRSECIFCLFARYSLGRLLIEFGSFGVGRFKNESVNSTFI